MPNLSDQPDLAEVLKRVELKQKKLEEIQTKSQSNGRSPSRTPTVEAVMGRLGTKGNQAPSYVRPDSLKSRGLQFQRVAGMVAGLFDPDECTVECDIHTRLKKAMVDTNVFNQVKGGSWVMPFATDLMGEYKANNSTAEGVEQQELVPYSFRQEMKQLCQAGTGYANGGFDRDEALFLLTKSFNGDSKTAQSWLDETLGGALVAPPEFGELIQLFRNKDALINAGCRVVPLPPSGRIKYPRQTSPTTGYFIGEGQSITSSNFGTGTLTLSGKKCAALVTLNDELIRFASPATEAILRADMTKTLSLTVDYYGLQGQGSDTAPLGLINTANIVTIAPTTAASGNTGAQMSLQDLYTFIGSIEANNGEFQGWILRPELFYSFVGSRAAVYNGNATVPQGQFVADQFRGLGQGFGPVLAGYKATTTPQVNQNRVQGTNTALTYVVGGQWDDFIMAMFGTIEFAQATQGDTMFANDQTVVRAILTMDSAPRHPGVFAFCDKLQLVVGP